MRRTCVGRWREDGPGVGHWDRAVRGPWAAWDQVVRPHRLRGTLNPAAGGPSHQER